MKFSLYRIIFLILIVFTGSVQSQSVTVHYPNGFESLHVGARHGIIWDYSGFNTVRIEFSSNNGSTWSTISGAGSLPNTQSYFNWTIPNQVSGVCLIRIIDNSNTIVRDVSNNPFSIIAMPVPNPDKYIGGPLDGYNSAKFNNIPVTVNYPNGGDVFVVGTRQYVTWTYNSLNLVDVEYSLDNGSSWSNISTVSAIQGFTIWDVPVILSNTCLIRVIDIFNSNNVDQSDQLFSIIGIPVVTPGKYSGGAKDGYESALNVNPMRVLSPNGGETFVAGSVMNITWRYPSLNNVNIFLSTNNGTNWTTIGSAIPSNNGSFNYTIPVAQIASSTCLIRVDDAANALVKDTSDAVFTIQSSNRTFGGAYDGYSFGTNVQRLVVVYPDGGDTLYSGTRATITWQYQSLNNVQVGFSTNNGSNWTNIGSPVAANIGMVNWLVPVVSSNDCLVRVMEVTDNNIVDISNQTFSIQTLGTPDPGKYSGGSLDGYNFGGPRIDLITPDGGDIYYGGTIMSIAWVYHNSRNTTPPNIAIELSTNGGSTWGTTVTGSIASTTGYFRYTVPAINTTQGRIRVRDLTNGSITDSSHTDFEIISALPVVDANKYSGGALDGYSYAQSADPITVVSPNGGELYYQSGRISITWEYNSFNMVQVSASTNNGTSWFNIGSPVQGVLGLMNWNPGVGDVSANCRVRVLDVLNTFVRDSSDAVFTIIANPILSPGKYSGGNFDGYSSSKQIQVLSANGGEIYNVGSRISFAWEYQSLSQVTLEVSTDNGSSWTLLANTIPGNQGSFNWTPSLSFVSTTCLFRVTDNANPTLTDISDAVFEIQTSLTPISAKYSGGAFDGYSYASSFGNLLVTYPNGGEVLYSGQRTTLQWNHPSTETVQLAYSTNNGSTWVNITTLAGNIGQFNWNMPALNSTQMLFRVNEISNPVIRDSSDAVFTILPALTVNTAKYSGGGYDGYVSHSNLSPDPIRYSGGALDGYASASNKPSLVLLNPQGGESWYVGSVQNISWNYSSLNNVQVQISINGGSTYSTIGTVAAMNGNINYTVPSTPSTTCIVRVIDAGNTVIRDSSAAFFEIIPLPVVDINKYQGGSFDGYAMRSSVSPVTVITPNGGDNLFVGTQYTIIWSYNSQNNVRIEFSSDGGSSFTTIVASVPAQQRMYNWLVPGILSNTCRIRVRDVLSSGIFDVSDSNFSIINLPIVNNGKYSGGGLDGYADADACVSPIATLSGGANLCLGNSTIITITQSGTVPYSITYSDGTVQSTVTGINFTPYFLVITPTATATYSLVSISNCLGAGTVNGSAVVQVSPAPVATMSGTTNICVGGSTQLTISLQGLSPWTFSYTDGTGQFSITGVTQSPYILSVTPVNNSNYSLLSVNTSCGSGTVSGSAAITINPPPTATLSGTQTLCSGTSGNIHVNFTGGSPWNLTWTDGTNPVTVSGITDNPYIFPVTPSQNTTYLATNLSTTCTGTVSGSALVQVNPLPTAILQGNQVICPGNPAVLSFSLTGSSPWNITYSDGTSSFVVTGITTSPYFVSHTPASTRTYSIVSYTDQLCPGIPPVGTVVVQVNTPPIASISGTQSVCTGGSAFLTVSLSGPSPWDISWTDGTSTSSQSGITSSPYFISITPSINSTYNLNSVTSNCVGSVSGQAIITMVSSPSAALSGNQTICPGTPASLTLNLTGGGPWSVQYTDGTLTGNITGITATPYVFSVTPVATLTYSLVSVTEACPGNVTGTAQINHFTQPFAAISGTSTICSGNTANLSFILAGVQPWSVTYSNGTSPVTINGITSSPFVLVVTPTVNTTYSVVSVSDLNCSASGGSGTAEVSVQPIPVASISGTGTVCAGSPVIMSIQISGISPWDIDYTDGTTISQVTGISSSPYLLSVSSVNSTTYTLTQVNGSCTGNVSGQGTLTVTPSPTANLTGTATVCPGNPTTLSVSFTSTSPWSITYTEGTNPISVSGINSNPYLFSVTPSTTRTYSLTSVQNALCTGVATGSPVVTVSPAPHATMSGNTQICSGSSAQLSINFTGAGPWDIVWTDGTSPNIVNGITINPFITSVSPLASTTYSVVSVLSGCAGTVSGSAQVQVFTPPSASITGGTVICTGGSTALSVNFTGLAPWNYTYSDGTIQTSVSGVSNSPHVFIVSPNASRTYSLVSMSGICAGTVSGTAVVTLNNQLPNAVLSGNNTICTFNPTTLTFNITGNSPWNIVYTDGIVPYSITGLTSSPYLVTVSPGQNTTYTLLNVNNVCGNGIVFGTAQIQTSTGPAAHITGASSVCAGGQTVLSVALSGPNPWDLTWTDGTTPVNVTGLTSSPYLIPVSPSANTTYSLVSINSSCSGTVSGSVPVAVLSTPVATLSGTQTICAGQPADLTISLSGAGPFDVTWTDGTIVSTIPGITQSAYVLSLSPQVNRQYQLVSVTGACVGSVSGVATVTVLPSPTVSISADVGFCPNGSSQLTFHLTGQQPWSIIYTDGVNPVTHVGITSSPFISTVSPVGNTTYDVSALADGICVIANPGAQVSLIEYPIPAAALSGSGTVCAGMPLQLTVNLTGTSPWNIQYTDGTNTVGISGISNSPYTFTVTANSARTYSLVSVTGATCPGTVSGTATLGITPSPTATISGSQTICPGNGTALSVQFTSSSPWDIQYTDGTNTQSVLGITQNPYVFQVSPSSSRSYNLVSVQNALCSGIVSGSANIQVSAPPQASISGNYPICQGDGANISVQLIGSSPWDLSWTDGTTTFTQTGITLQPFIFSTSPAVNTTYTLVNVFSGCPGTVSGSASVSISPIPTANLTGGATLCTGGSTSLSIGFTGVAPWTFTFTDGTNPVTLPGITQNPYILTVSPGSSTTYSLINLSGVCAGTVSGTAIVTINNLLPNAVLSGTQSICTSTPALLTIHFSGNAPWSIIYTDGVQPYTATGITSSPLVVSVSPVVTTTYTILNVNNACGNGVVFGTAIVSPTVTPTAVISGNSTICPGGFVQISVQMTGASPWNLTWTDGTTAISQTGINASPYLITVSPSANTTYQLTAFSNACTGTFSGSSTVDVLIGGPTAQVTGTQTICTGNQATLSVQLTGTPPWSFVYTDGINQTTVNNIVISPYILNVTPVFATSYSMVSVSDGVCIGNASPTPAVVTLTSPPVAGITGNQTICSGGTANLSTVLTGTSPWNITYTDGITPVTINGITSSPFIIQVSPSVSSTYILTQVFALCTGSTSGQAQVQVNVGGPTASFSPSQTICAGTGTSVVMQLSGMSPWNLTWTDGTNNTVVTGISTNPYILSVTPLTTTSYSLTQISDALCTGTLPLSGTHIQVTPQPLASISGAQSICLGSTANLSVNLSSTAPWNLTWTDGTNQVNVSGITSSPYVFSVSPLVNTTYSVVSVSNQCAGNVTGTAPVSVLPALSAVMSGSRNICPGDNASLTVNITGSSPWTITYTDGTTPVTVTGLTQSPYLISVTPGASTSYSLVSVSNPSCTGSVSGNAIIQVLSIPDAITSGSQTICEGASASISFQLSGSFPMTLRYSNGSFNVTHTGVNSSPFIVQVSPSASTTYTIISVNNTCAGTFSGSTQVIVNPKPTASVGGTQGICVGNTAQLTVSLNGVSPWFFVYTDGTLNTTVTGITSSPYILTVTPFNNTAYTITQVTDLFCVNNGNFGTSLVSIVSPPTGTISGPTALCSGNTGQLNFFLTGGSPWELTYSDGTSNFNITGISTSPYVLNITPVNSTQYVLTGISDQNCVSTGLNHTHLVNISQGPSATLSGTQVVCTGQQAMLTFTLTGVAPWTVSYLQGAQVVTVPGISTPVFTLPINPGSTTVYTLQSVTDALCSGTVSGTATVTVNSPPSAGIIGSTSICSGSSTNLSVNLSGSAPWSFTWSDGVNLQTVNNVTATPYVLSLSPSITTFYSITSVSSGNCQGTASGNAVITVGAPPSASFGAGVSICVGQTAVLPVSLTGIGPWSLSYSDGVSTQTITGISTGTYGLLLSPIASTTYTLLTVMDGSCNGSIQNATAVVSVSTTSAGVSLSGNASVCSGNIANLVFNFTGSSPWSVTFSDGLNTQTLTGIVNSPYLHTVAPSVSTTYTPVTVSNGCGIGTVSGTAVIRVDTQAPTAAFTYSVSGYQVFLNNTSQNGALHFWNFGDGNTSTNYNTSHTYAGPGFYTITLTVSNACGTFTTSTQIFIDYGVSVDDVKLDKAVQVYPNPGSGLYKIGVTGMTGADLQFLVTDASGKILFNEKHFNLEDRFELPVNLKQHAAGTYFLKIMGTDGVEVNRKLILIPE